MATVEVNLVGLEHSDYRGQPTTLCPGCGHNSIANQIISVAYELSLAPHTVIKLSGIGCSSKSPAYFLGRSHGFNALHGRMPSVGTGAVLANRSLKAIGVSGDGDSGSIGMGQFKHVLRRNAPLVYIIENNGVYGLTKGQHSATQDMGVKQKYYGINQFPGIDLCIEALSSEATFVARSFAGAPKQVRELLKAAMSHDGLALVDIISPCVAFNDTPESTKSYAYGRTHQVSLHDVSFVPREEEIYIDEDAYDEEGRQVVVLHDGSRILLRKLDEPYNPTNRADAVKMLEEARADREIVTGLIYYDADRPNLLDTENLVGTPLVHLREDQLRPPKERLDEIMQEMMQ